MSEKRLLNRLLAWVYFIIACMLVLSYLVEVINGSRTLTYYLIFITIVLLPPSINTIYQIKHPENKVTLYLLGAAYLVFYSFVLFTTKISITCCYIFPLIVYLILLHNSKLLIRVNIFIIAVNAAQIIKYSIDGVYADHTQLINMEIQIGLILVMAGISTLCARIDSRINNFRISEKQMQLQKNQELLATIQETSSKLMKMMTLLDANSNLLVKEAEQSLSSMQEVTQGATSTAESVQEQLQMSSVIQEKTQQTKELAKEFTTIAKESLSTAEHGTDAMGELKILVAINLSKLQDTISVIVSLQSDIHKVHEVIGIIESVAQSTSLLSLNANIEAARAGEAGKGFAVVANEIRNLANNTQDSVVQAQEVLNTITANSDSVSVAISELSKAYDSQNEHFNYVSQIFGELLQRVTKIENNSHELENYMSVLETSNTGVIEAIQNISAISEETMANSENSQSINESSKNKINEIQSQIQSLHALSDSLNSAIDTTRD